MKTTKKRLVLGIAGAALLCVGATFTTLAATTEAPITDETMLANIEALSQNEGQDYNNAKLAYCGASTGDRIGCKSALFRQCTGVFCE